MNDILSVCVVYRRDPGASSGSTRFLDPFQRSEHPGINPLQRLRGFVRHPVQDCLVPTVGRYFWDAL